MNTEEKTRSGVQEIKNNVLQLIDLSRETGDEELYSIIDAEIKSFCSGKPLNVIERRRLRKEVFSSIRELDVLQPLLEDENVTEIMVNGPDDIFVERLGQIKRYEDSFSSRSKLEDVIQQIVAGCNRSVNEANPIADARLKSGARVNIVLSPVALNGPAITIRRFPNERITMDKLIDLNALSLEVAEFIKKLVISGYNIFISGGTGSGKTTFLNALSDFIPADERIITIEDNAELQITHIPNIVKMETRKQQIEDCKEISIRDLIKSSLRMRPDRVIVGEVRGAEVIDMLQAMNTGHDGSMSTGHANSASDMLTRLETMFLMGMDIPLLAARGQVAGGIDIIVHLGRLRDGSRKVLEIVEIIGDMYDSAEKIKTNTLYKFKENGVFENGSIKVVWEKENEIRNRTKLIAKGVGI